MFLVSVPCISSKCIRLDVMCIRVFHIMFYIRLSMTVYTSTKRTLFIQYFSNRSFRLQLFQKRIITYRVVSYMCVCVNLSVSYIILYLSCLSLYVCICVNECFFFLCTGQQGRRIRISMTLGRCLFVFRLRREYALKLL